MLKLFNTMGRKLEEFTPITPGFVGFYGCGPTVYNYAHIGNLRAYVFLDTLDRALTFLGYDKKHVMNITDVGHLTGDDDSGEDKMLKTAAERHKSVMEVADFYTNAFLSDIGALNIIKPDVICRATEHISDMIALIKRLESNGHTYFKGGNLYYDVSTYSDYGKLAGLDMESLRAGARVDIDPNKKSPYDFVLWFTKSKFDNHALLWDSPWGVGYPGWHIECSAMSMKYLGEHFDIHTGGVDHIPIHHTNEIAQSEGATGRKWVNYWLHNEFLVIGKDNLTDKNVQDKKSSEAVKMSKSSGNFLRLQSLLDEGYDALDYRYFLLTGHYRKQITFSFGALDGAKNGRVSLVTKVIKLLEKVNDYKERVYKKGDALSRNITGSGSVLLGDAAYNHIEDFKSALENDLSTPMALGALSKVFKDKELTALESLEVVARMDSVLGLDLLGSAKRQREKDANKIGNFISTKESVTHNDLLHSGIKENATSNGTLSNSIKDNGNNNEPQKADGDARKKIESLIAKRVEAKKNKDWALSDAIRNELKAMGVTLIDTKTGVTWTMEK